MKSIVVLVGLAAVALLLYGFWQWRSVDPPSRTGPSAAQAPGSPGERREVEEPEIVRLIVRPTGAVRNGGGAASSAAAVAADDEVVGEYVHLGALDPEVTKGLVENCEQQERRYAKRLANAVDAGSSAALLEEANDTVRWILARRQRQCLLAGDYLTTEPGAPKPPLSVDGAEVVSTGGFVDGQYVELTYVMPLASDPELRAAVEYRATMLDFDASEKARRFNELPDAERAALAKRIRAIMNDSEASPAERRFVRDTVGHRNVLDTKLLIVRRN